MTLPGPVSRGQVGHSLRRQHKDYSKVSLPLVVAQALTELPGNLWNEEEENRRNSPSKKPISPKLRQEKEDEGSSSGVTIQDDTSEKNRQTNAADEAFTLGWPRTLHECYEVGEEIGRGSFGIVREAKERWPIQFTTQNPSNPYLQQKFAVKSIPKRPKRRTRRKRYVDEGPNAEKAVRRQREKLLGEVAFMVALADCPFSAQLVGAYEDETHAHLVVELCEGGDLKHLLERRGVLTEKEACEVIFTALHFINHCHQKGFVFSDVKPANFMLKFKPHEDMEEDMDGDWDMSCYETSSSSYSPLVVKGIDFGCSQRTGDASERGMLIKRTGTPAYWAPEVFMRCYNHKADVWSCGMMMYELLVGKLPFWDNIEQCSPKDVQRGVIYGEVDFDFASYKAYDSIDSIEESSESRASQLSESAQDLIRKMLIKDPRSRITVQEALEHPWIQENHF